MSSMNEDDRATRLVVIGSLSRVLSLGLIAFASIGSARYLAPTERGDLAFAIQVGYLVGSLAALGQERSTYSGLGGLRPLSQAMSVLLGVLSIVPLVLLMQEVDQITWLASTGAVATSTYLARGLEGELVRLRLAGRLATLQGLIGVLMVISFAMLSAADVSEAEPWAASFGAAMALPVVVVHSLQSRQTRRSGCWFRPLGSHLSLIAGGDAGLSIAQRGDRILLGIVDGSASLGRYSLVGSMTEIALLPISIAAQIRSKQGSSQHSRVDRFAGIITLGVLLALIAAGDRLVEAFAGADYLVGVELWVLLAIASLSIGLYRRASAALLSRGEVRQVSAIDMVVGMSAMALYAGLIPAYGSVGAALGTLTSYSLGLALVLWRTGR